MILGIVYTVYANFEAYRNRVFWLNWNYLNFEQKKLINFVSLISLFDN